MADTRRRGGRAARKALHAAPTPDEERAVRPGMSSGRYQPLSETDVELIHSAVLDVLEKIGLANAIPSSIELVTAAGGSYSDEGRLLFPRALVEDTIANAARNITLFGQDPKYDMLLSGTSTHFGTAGAAVHMVDCETREYRESTLSDLYDVACIVNEMDHIHFYQRSLVPRDMASSMDMDINTAYACASGTSKHIGLSFIKPENAEAGLSMLHMIAGGEDKWRERPFASLSCCFVVPPLRFAEDACHVMETCVRGGMPILLLAAGQAGATSPASLAGAVVQEVAEVLAGLVYVNLLAPKHPAIFGTWPFVSDLRTGAMSGGSGEQAVLMAACGQMGRHYDLPTGIAAGMADSKIPDAQSGYEKGYTNTLAGHCGANLVYESAGMQGSLLGTSLEGYVIDNDMLGAINRTIRGIEVNADSLSFETMREVCLEGPVHYLGHDQTLNLMKRDYVYPEVGDRLSPKDWAEQGSTDVLQRAKKKVEEILAGSRPQHISEQIDAEIRSRLSIQLPREKMR
ncbi:MAG: methyltransferase [Gammaproteobacteria bacterium]|nr:methyltransferase [Gammaproteobacteria bacterium]